MKSIKQQYIDLNEGKMSQANFMRSLRMTMPHLVTNVTSFKDSVRILKNKGILSEADVKISSETADKLKKVIDSITADNSEFHRDGYTMGFFEGENPNQELTMTVSDAVEGTFDGDFDGNKEKLEKAKQLISASNHPDKVYALEKIEQKLKNVSLDEASSMNGSEDSYDYQGKTVNIDPQSASKVGDIAKLYDQEQNEYNGEVVSVDSHTNMIHVDPNSIKPNGANAYLKEAKQNEKTGAYGQDGASMYKGFSEDTHVNRQELTKGIKMEHEQNPYEEYKKVVAKVIKNLKKDPNYYTHYQLSGVFDFKPTTIGGKGDGRPESHQMKPIDKENYIDKERGMKPVKDIEKVKASSNKAHKEIHPNKIGKTSSMSLIAKTVRGLQKMNATGEKYKKINVKEGLYDTNSTPTEEEVRQELRDIWEAGRIDDETWRMANKALPSFNIDDNMNMVGPTTVEEIAIELIFAVTGKYISNSQESNEDEYDEENIDYDDYDYLREEKPYFTNRPADPNKYKIVKDSKGQIVKATNEDGVTFQKNEEAIAIDNGKKIKINGFIEQQTKVKAIYIVNNSGYTIDIDGLEKVSDFPIKGQMAEEIRKKQLQREIREIFDGRDNMSYTAGDMTETDIYGIAGNPDEEMAARIARKPMDKYEPLNKMAARNIELDDMLDDAANNMDWLVGQVKDDTTLGAALINRARKTNPSLVPGLKQALNLYNN
jgi:hypothetical protein